MSDIDRLVVTDVFARIPRPADPESLHVVPLVANAFLGVFGTGSPALFFELVTEQTGTLRTLARGVELIVSSRFEIVQPDRASARTRSGYAVVLRELAQVDIFATVAAHVASRLRAEPSALARQRDVDDYISSWVDFFTSEGMSPERAIGLWGELYVLSALPDVARGVACWVGPYGQMFDFMGNGVSLEIKTSLRTSVASFSLGQLDGRDGGHTVFVRVLNDEANGKSLDRLVSDVRALLPDTVQFDATLVRTGYRAGTNSETMLTCEDVRAIPNPKVPRPVVNDVRIRSVRFEVDVDGLRADLVGVMPLFRRLIARMPRSAVASRIGTQRPGGTGAVRVLPR